MDFLRRQHQLPVRKLHSQRLPVHRLRPSFQRLLRLVPGHAAQVETHRINVVKNQTVVQGKAPQEDAGPHSRNQKQA